MSLSQDDVKRMAQLARISLTNQEKNTTLTQLNSILAMVDKMQNVSTQLVTPMSHPLDLTQTLRADQVTELNLHDRCLALAPEARDGLYLVPRVVE